jgi:ethanolamine utilization microcompartment shell protein EutL
MIVVGNAVYVVWSENMIGGDTGDEIFFTKSVNGGATFTQKINLSNNPGDSNSPSIGVFRNIVHIVWADSTTESGHREILYRKSFNGGNTFANAINLSNTQLGSSNPSIAVFRNNIYVAWEEQQAPDNFDIVFRKSTNNGINFDATMNLSNNPGDSRGVEIAASQDNVYVVWDDRTGNVVGRDVFFIRSTNGGISFGATTIIIPDASSSDIAVAQNIA